MADYFDNSDFLKHQFPKENNSISKTNYWFPGLVGGVIVAVITWIVIYPKINYYKQALEQEQNNVKNKTAELDAIKQAQYPITPDNFNSY